MFINIVVFYTLSTIFKYVYSQEVGFSVDNVFIQDSWGNWVEQWEGRLTLNFIPFWETPSKCTLKGGKIPKSFQDLLSRVAEVSDIYFDSDKHQIILRFLEGNLRKSPRSVGIQSSLPWHEECL